MQLTHRVIAPLSVLLLTAAAQAQNPPAQPKTTAVLVILTIKPGVERQQIVKVMPREVRATVRLYLDGKIRQWFSRADGKGVMFILDSTSVDDAKAAMETLPLAKEQLMDYQYIPIGPLTPLASLLGPPPDSSARQR